MAKKHLFRNPKWSKKGDQPEKRGLASANRAMFSESTPKPQRREKDDYVKTTSAKKVAKILQGDDEADDADPATVPDEVETAVDPELMPDVPDEGELPATVDEDGELNSSGNRRGMHLTSQRAKQIRKRRTYYPKLAPKIACDTCAYQSQCPKFRPGYECYFLPFLRQHTIRNFDDIKDAALAAVEADGMRLQLSMMFERLTGTITGDVSQHIDGYMRRLATARELATPPAPKGNQGPVTVSGPANSIADLFRYQPPEDKPVETTATSREVPDDHPVLEASVEPPQE